VFSVDLLWADGFVADTTIFTDADFPFPLPGNTTPVVRHEVFNSSLPPHLTTFLQDMDQPFVF